MDSQLYEVCLSVSVTDETENGTITTVLLRLSLIW